MGLAALPREIDAARRRWGTRSPDGRAAPAIRVAAAVLVTLAVAVGAVAATSWGPVRHQLALSFSREPAQYVEVSLTSAPTASDLGDPVPTVRVPVTIRSHSEALVRQPITLQVRRAGQVVTRRSVVSVPSDGTAHVVLAAPVPRAFGPWSAEVSLPGRPERLLLHGDAPGGFGG